MAQGQTAGPRGGRILNTRSLAAARWLAIALIVALASACTSTLGGTDRGGSVASLADQSVATIAIQGLCEARAAAATGGIPAATGPFLDRAHDPLHVLAASIAPTAPGTASRLLEATSVIEAQLTEASSPTFLADLDRLISVTREAVTSVGLEAPSC